MIRRVFLVIGGALAVLMAMALPASALYTSHYEYGCTFTKGFYSYSKVSVDWDISGYYREPHNIGWYSASYGGRYIDSVLAVWADNTDSWITSKSVYPYNLSGWSGWFTSWAGGRYIGNSPVVKFTLEFSDGSECKVYAYAPR